MKKTDKYETIFWCNSPDGQNLSEAAKSEIPRSWKKRNNVITICKGWKCGAVESIYVIKLNILLLILLDRFCLSNPLYFGS